MSLDQTEIMQLKARVAQLETETKSNSDLLQALGRCFFAPPQPQQKPTAPAANDPLICPNCGKPKKANYDVCYKCWEKANPR